MPGGGSVSWPKVYYVNDPNNPINGVGLGPEIPGDPLPKLKKYKNMALFADVFSAGTRVYPSHAEGLQVGYADGSVRFVPFKVIKDDLALFNDNFLTNTLVSNMAVRRLWDKFDRN